MSLRRGASSGGHNLRRGLGGDSPQRFAEGRGWTRKGLDVQFPTSFIPMVGLISTLRFLPVAAFRFPASLPVQQQQQQHRIRLTGSLVLRRAVTDDLRRRPVTARPPLDVSPVDRNIISSLFPDSVVWNYRFDPRRSTRLASARAIAHSITTTLISILPFH